MSNQPLKPSERAYRYEWKTYATMEDDYGHSSTRSQLECHGFEIVKHTPKGFFILLVYSRRFVRDGCKRQFAHKTKEAAFAAFRARRNRYKAILCARLNDVNASLEARMEDAV